jgi:hypothetical protein
MHTVTTQFNLKSKHTMQNVINVDNDYVMCMQYYTFCMQMHTKIINAQHNALCNLQHNNISNAYSTANCTIAQLKLYKLIAAKQFNIINEHCTALVQQCKLICTQNVYYACNDAAYVKQASAYFNNVQQCKNIALQCEALVNDCMQIITLY